MQSLPKSIFIFVLCIPLAILLGIVLATPLDTTTMMIVGACFLLLLTPVLITSHQFILILSWNAFVNAFFLPGQPYIWMPVTAVSALFLILTRTLNRGKMESLSVPSVAWPLVLLFVVSLVTARLTGGVGSYALGSNIFGGKRYFFLWGAIFGYFVLSNVPIPENKRQVYSGLFFLSSITAVFSNVAFMLGENFYFLFLLFPVEWAMTQASSENSFEAFTRLGGFGPGSVAILSYIMLRWGIRGTFNIRYAHRLLLFLGSFAGVLMSGYRASFLLCVFICVVQMLLEGLYKTKHLLIFGSIALVCGTLLVPFANKLPISAQRCLTLLPLDLDSGAIEAARGSTDWRVEMWRVVVPDIPKYLLLGKGFTIDPKDLYFAQQNISVRKIAPFEISMVAGDYHNGPLTVIIPFGIWGAIAFVWFCAASIRLLWRNFRYGEESIKNINRFMLTAFLAKLIFFIFVFGAFYLDLSAFTGIVAMSVALNRGMARARAPQPVLVPVQPEPEPLLPQAPAWQPAFARRMQTW